MCFSVLSTEWNSDWFLSVPNSEWYTTELYCIQKSNPESEWYTYLILYVKIYMMIQTEIQPWFKIVQVSEWYNTELNYKRISTQYQNASHVCFIMYSSYILYHHCNHVCFGPTDYSFWFRYEKIWLCIFNAQHVVHTVICKWCKWWKCQGNVD